MTTKIKQGMNNRNTQYDKLKTRRGNKGTRANKNESKKIKR